MDYARAVAALYQAPHGEFVAERKRLAAELKAGGDRDGAKTFGKLARPPISAWAVNQLYWHARDAFDRLMATAAQLRDGDLSASAAHREALARLRQRAATILTEAGHNASEGTLRRTTLTLSALAATGSFAPDLPGALADDRDPPGFEAAAIGAPVERPPPMLSVAPPARADADGEAGEAGDDGDDGDDGDGEDPEISAEEREFAADLLRANAKPARHLASVPGASAPAPPPTKRARHLSAVPLPEPAATDDEERATRERSAAQRAAAEQAERARSAERDRARTQKRERFATALRTARGEVDSRRRTAERLRGELAGAEAGVAAAERVVADLERELADLDG